MSTPARLRRVSGFAAAAALLTTVFGAPAAAQSTPELEVKEFVFDEEFAPGDLVSYQPIVHNSGSVTAEVVALTLNDDHYAGHEQRFSNCQYEDHADGTSRALCQFEIALEPGETAQVPAETAVGLRVQPDVPDGHANHANYQVSGFSDLLPDDGEFGDGPELKLEKITDADFDGGEGAYANVTFYAGPNPGDFAAIGGDISGAVGDVVTIELGIENHGPATLARRDPGESAEPAKPQVSFTFPAGVTVLDFPAPAGDLAFTSGCFPLVDGEPDFESHNEPGALEYQCFVGERALAAGESWLFPVEVEITSATAAAGEVAAISEPNDPDHDNNLAEITLHGEDNGGSGGGLPVTGAATTMMAGGGLLALLLGAGLYLVARRRRVRFADEAAD